MRQSSSKKKTNDQRIIPPLDPRALVHLICILTQFENTLFQTFKPGVATLVNSNGTEKKKKKKKVREKQKMVEKLGQIECCIFTLTMLPSKVLRKKVRFTIGARASNSAAGQKFMLKGLSLSLSLVLQTAASHVQKNGRPCFLPTSRIPFSSMLFTPHEFTRFLTSPFVQIRD